jgi:hypothetical protein
MNSKCAGQVCLAAFAAGTASLSIAQTDDATRAAQAFEVVRSVLQHPRCANCHVPEDSPRQLDRSKDLQAMLAHNGDDKLVGWGWNPGLGRNPVPISRERFVAAFKTWMDLGAPCPS